MLADHLIDGAAAVVVAWIGIRQHSTHRALKRSNGAVQAELEAIHRNLIDNPGPPTHPPVEGHRAP